jgi:hypothetical protein
VFKSGQLVQSIKYGDHYVVVTAGPDYAMAKPLTPKFWFSETMSIEYDRFRLVGNNYQPKPNTPAR